MGGFAFGEKDRITISRRWRAPHGFLSVGMALREEFAIFWSRATVFLERPISPEVQWRLNALISGGGYAAYQLVFGSDVVGSFLVGMAMPETCSLPRIDLFWGSLYSGGNCA